MGAAVSTWQEMEDDSVQLTKKDILDIVGGEHFSEEKFLEYAGGNEWITVAEFKLCLAEYASQYIEENKDLMDGYDPNEETLAAQNTVVEEHNELEGAAVDNGAASPEKDGQSKKGNGDEDTYDGSYETGTADETSYMDGSTVKTAEDTATKEPTVEGGETRTSAGDDFSESVLPAPSIVKLSEEELDQLRLETADLHEKLTDSRVDGVYPEDRKEDVARFRVCLASMYEQTGEPYLQGPDEISSHLAADYYHVLDFDLASTRTVARYYEGDSTFNFVGIPDVVGRRPVSRAVVKKYSRLRVRHAIKSVEIDESPPNMCMYLLTVSSLITLNDDSPRRIMEIFYIKDRDDELKKAKYGPYYIFRQILVVLDSRPLYAFAETKLRPGDNDNWDDELTRPDWLVEQQMVRGGTVGELTADDEEGSGDGSYSGSDRDDEEDSESDEDEEEDGGSASKKTTGGASRSLISGGADLQTVEEEGSVGDKKGEGSVGSAGSKQSTVNSAMVSVPKKQESADAADDVSAMSEM